MEKSIFSERLKFLRKSKGYKTQKDLALAMQKEYRIGSEISVKNWESKRNISLPGIDCLEALCNLLECDADYLLCRQDEPRKAITTMADEIGLGYETIKKVEEYTTSQKAVLSDLINNDNIFSEFLSGLQKCTETAFRNFIFRRNQINKRERHQINTINDLNRIDYHLILKECEDAFENHGYIAEIFHILLNIRIIESMYKSADIYKNPESGT